MEASSPRWRSTTLRPTAGSGWRACRKACLGTAAAMGGKIYLTGGAINGSKSENSVYVYDPQAGAWTQLASMGTARLVHASAAVGGKLYVFGGFGAGGDLSTAEFYDPASNSWAQVTSLTSARHSPGMVAL